MKNKCIMRLTAFLTAAAILFAPAAGTGVFAAESAEREAAKEQDVQDPAQEAADGQEARDPAPETVIEDLREQIKGCISDKVDRNGIKEIEVKVN